MGNRISFGMAINEALYDLGLSPAKFGQMFHVSGTEVNRWIEQGLTPVSKYFIPICEELGINPLEHGFTASEIEAAQYRKKIVASSHAAAEMGWLIKEARINLGISQCELTRRAGFAGGGRVSHYENGVSVPSEAALSKLCEILGLNDAEMQKKRTAALKYATGKNRKGGEVD